MIANHYNMYIQGSTTINNKLPVHIHAMYKCVLGFPKIIFECYENTYAWFTCLETSWIPIAQQDQHHYYSKDKETQDSCYHSTSNGSNWHSSCWWCPITQHAFIALSAEALSWLVAVTSICSCRGERSNKIIIVRILHWWVCCTWKYCLTIVC